MSWKALLILEAMLIRVNLPKKEQEIAVMLCGAREAAESGRVLLESVSCHTVSWSFSTSTSFISLFNICPACFVPLLPANSKQVYPAYGERSGPKQLPSDQTWQLPVAFFQQETKTHGSMSANFDLFL